MPRLPAAVGLRSLSEVISAVGLSLALSWAGPACAQALITPAPGYLAALELHTADELLAVLSRAEELLLDSTVAEGKPANVTLLMHGPEVHVLLRQNYARNRAVVDLAARLSALGVVDIRACQTWMGGNGIDEADLQPFVGTVPNAVVEARRLAREESYIDF